MVPSSTPKPAADPCENPADPGGCVIVTDDCHPWEFASPDDVEQIAGWKLQIPVDAGPREFATGEAVLDSAGIPVAYVVASGDIPDFVSERFCVNLAYLNAINGVRRQGAMSLFVGDTINFDAHTILTVGDQNGTVYEGSRPSPMPPQR